MQSDVEQRAREIVEGARSQRRRPSRHLWMAAVAISSTCVLAFVIAMLANPSTSSDERAPHAQTTNHGWGFVIGLTAGLVIGIAIGFAIARRRAEQSAQASSESSASHSERSSP